MARYVGGSWLAIAVVLLCCACSPVSPAKIRSDYATVIAALQATPSPEPTVTPMPLRRPTTPAVSAPVTRPTPSPTPSPTPVPQPLRVVAQGFGQVGHQLSYAFEVENPSAGVAYLNTGYRATFYNAAHVAVQTESGIVQLVLPEQRTGQASMVSLIHDDYIASINVTLQPGRTAPAQPQPAFTADQLAYTPGQSLGKVSGVVYNPYAFAIPGSLVSAVAYDADGTIIGGGFTILSLLPAMGGARAEVPVLTAAAPDRVRLFVDLSDLEEITAAGQASATSGDVRILAQGYGETQSTVGYALMLQNDSSTLEYDGLRYEATFYDAAGVVLVDESDTLERILPGERIGVAQQRVLPQGGRVARMEARIRPGTSQAAAEKVGLTGGPAVFALNRGVYSVTGTIANAGAEDVKVPDVFAVAYDARGAIIGGGATVADLVPAGGRTEVEVFIASTGTPARVELYAAPGALTYTH